MTRARVAQVPIEAGRRSANFAPQRSEIITVPRAASPSGERADQSVLSKWRSRARSGKVSSVKETLISCGIRIYFVISLRDVVGRLARRLDRADLAPNRSHGRAERSVSTGRTRLRDDFIGRLGDGETSNAAAERANSRSREKIRSLSRLARIRASRYPRCTAEARSSRLRRIASIIRSRVDYRV